LRSHCGLPVDSGLTGSPSKYQPPPGTQFQPDLIGQFDWAMGIAKVDRDLVDGFGGSTPSSSRQDGFDQT